MAPSSSDVGFLASSIFLILSIFSNFCTGSTNEPTEFSKSLSRGWNDKIHWQTLSQGLDLAAKLDKPAMVIIHKTWCSACKSLKRDFAKNAEIQEMSQHFVMVNTQDDEEPKEDKYAPDGSYIPRILFVDGSSNVRVQHYNEDGNKKYRYFYSSAREVITSMRKVITTWRHDSYEEGIDDGEGQIYDEL
ncbi:TXNDC12 [Acanthosepion pharaonis]|uniref:TXNDC12 n=1 Tax=Acanthosepion pharaonis TaxID=158019 RepID=A0A812CUC2_ACAPH|nr:TXNDC12 [Sepia pharaonis]